MKYPVSIEITEVGPRDGLQNQGSIIATDKKVAFIDAGLDLSHIVKSRVYTLYDERGYAYDEDINHISSFTTFIPSLKYTWDNALWSYIHPVEGFRYYVKYKTSPGINERSLTFHSATMDVRKYHRLFNGISIAGRLFGGMNWGANAQKFRLGGVPWLFSSDRYSDRYYGGETELSIEELYFSEYVMPLRGAQISNKFGQNVILGNIELRLPFLVYYFPAIKYIGQINGVLFTDFGVAWDSNYPEFWANSSWHNNSNIGWLMSYGIGPRFIFLGFPWQLDYAWGYNPHKGTISDRQWYLTIGLDF